MPRDFEHLALVTEMRIATYDSRMRSSRYRKTFVDRLGDGQIDALIRRDRVAVWGSAVVLLVLGALVLLFALAIAYIDLRGQPCAWLIALHPDAGSPEGPAVEAVSSSWPLGITCTLAYTDGTVLHAPASDWTATVLAGIGVAIALFGVVRVPVRYGQQRMLVETLAEPIIR